MDNHETNHTIDEPEGTRPGPKTLVAVLVIALAVFAFFNWNEVMAAIDIF